MAKLVLVTEAMRTVAGSTDCYEQMSGANLLVPRTGHVPEGVCFGLVCAWFWDLLATC